MTRLRSPRDRPSGLAPVGSSTTFTFGLLYPIALLLLVPVALSPWMFDVVGDLPFDAHDDALMGRYGMLLLIGGIPWLALLVPYVLLYQARRYAGVCIFFALGLFSAVAVPVAVLTVAGLLLSSIGHEPDLVIFAYMFGGCLLVMLATWPWLVRGLRLKYWQPWTTPDQWEVGDERLARWAQDLTGVEDRRPATDGTRPPPRRRRR